MMRKSTKLAFREWSGSRPAPEAVRTPSNGFRVSQQNASVMLIFDQLECQVSIGWPLRKLG